MLKNSESDYVWIQILLKHRMRSRGSSVWFVVGLYHGDRFVACDKQYSPTKHPNCFEP